MRRNKLWLLKVVLLAGLVLSVALVPVAYADIYDVSNTNDSGDGSLRKAITDANANPGHDTITFSISGTITLGSALPQITDDVTITGPGADSLSISGADSYRVFEISSSTAVTITGVTVQNGKSDLGGGILNIGTLSMSNSTLSGNTATDIGGGIYNGHGTVEIINSTLSENTAWGGGGVLNDYGTVEISNSTLSGNTATDGGGGGGILNMGTLNISNSTLSGNTASSGGGILSDDMVNIINSTISGNTAGSGGGILNIGTLNISNSTLSGNTATDWSGGGIYNSAFLGMVNISNCTFSGNTATDKGGGIYSYWGTVSISNCTFYANTASDGGGIHNRQQGTVEMQNTIVNQSTGGDCTSATSGVFSGSNNLIDDHDSGACSSISTAGVTNLDANLQDNGGPTSTHALQAGSNAIDAVTHCTYIGSGDNPLFGDGETITTDQRSVSRPQPLGGNCDIGAYEARRFTLTVAGAGTGDGMVTNTEIDCDISAETTSGDCSETLVEMTVVNLEAQPGDDSVFVGWGGDCFGTELTTTVTMDADKTCTATFNLKPPPVPVGGYVVPVNRLELLAPWLGLVAVALLGAVAFAFLVQRDQG